MAFVASFNYCQEIRDQGQGKQPEIVNPMQIIRTKYMPTYFTVSIASAIYGLSFEHENTVRLIFKSPSGQVLADTGDAKTAKGREKADLLQVNVEFRNIALESEGEYYTELKLNDEVLGSYSIAVVKDVR